MYLLVNAVIAMAIARKAERIYLAWENKGNFSSVHDSHKK